MEIISNFNMGVSSSNPHFLTCTLQLGNMIKLPHPFHPFIISNKTLEYT